MVKQSIIERSLNFYISELTRIIRHLHEMLIKMGKNHPLLEQFDLLLEKMNDALACAKDTLRIYRNSKPVAETKSSLAEGQGSISGFYSMTKK